MSADLRGLRITTMRVSQPRLSLAEGDLNDILTPRRTVIIFWIELGKKTQSSLSCILHRPVWENRCKVPALFIKMQIVVNGHQIRAKGCNMSLDTLFIDIQARNFFPWESQNHYKLSIHLVNFTTFTPTILCLPLLVIHA